MQVLESGTGSGSLTHSLARAVAPGGAVHTFEFHQQRWQEAQAEFEQNILTDIVHSSHRDIEGKGFPESLHGSADAIVLDLPGPWNVRVPPEKPLKIFMPSFFRWREQLYSVGASTAAASAEYSITAGAPSVSPQSLHT
jgi:tRNA methyltransferase complex GCD14 subunit